ncbi:MAG: bifunctional (p)ppGpp synthetase/guanosine-3',5'-bis(diphosphate) 3'-pyrophosphohydrolase, partial [Bacilli bacterium]|nr:bifunctional (p)ppGpp synthetase/guanosine-3',5'-bis(diphosphate) 3'-pyrophosphohydrolase [Bacilli bacterium]
KDYIAMPKTNLYQSLHTTVFGIDGQLFEIQIRTYEMDKIAEYGIASHWSYKENKKTNNKDQMEQKLEIFRSIIELNEDASTPEEFITNVKKDLLFNDSIYVYTPKGDVIELPNGATCVDFAYRVHSEVGDKMVGAIVNDVIVPFDYKLKTGDIIKVNTSKLSNGPNKDWLNFVVTSQAKNKIRAFYTKREKDENLSRGADMFEKALRRRNLPLTETLNEYLDTMLETFKLKDLDDLYLAIGSGKYTVTSVMKVLNKKEDQKTIALKKNNGTTKKQAYKNDVLVEGMNEIKVTLSGCCKPIPGDNIIGYITKGSGITVHRSNCKNILDLDERLINVKWNEEISKKFPTDLLIYTDTQDNLLNIITTASANNILIDTISTITKSEFKIYSLTVLVENTEVLTKFCRDLENLKFVNKVERQVN